ncbi:hypothetical protein IW141_005024 [Coemansia sp. RSA 355]|nr:hypothetical protein IW141_005024 [Coemansia sp. RSA 355]
MERPVDLVTECTNQQQLLSINPTNTIPRVTLLKTAPRVPSTLRMVVDTEDESDTECNYDGGGQHRLLQTANSVAMRSNSEWYADPAPLPMLRKENSEPTLTRFANRSANSINCLPYPHTLDSYVRRPRPCSASTAPPSPYRFSIVTTNQEYKEYSYKKGADIVVQPSMMRGWFLKLRGKIKYSIGQVVASPSLILRGNRDITRGTARVNLSRKQQKTAHDDTNKLKRKSLVLTSGSNENHISNNNGRRVSDVSQADSDNYHVSWTNAKTENDAVSVVELITAAENVAEAEIAEAATAVSSRRTSGERNSILELRIQSNSEVTEVTLGNGISSCGSSSKSIDSPPGDAVCAESKATMAGCAVFLDKTTDEGIGISFAPNLDVNTVGEKQPTVPPTIVAT